VNEDTRFESRWADKGDRWELETLLLKSAGKSNRLKGTGHWPKKDTDPIEVSVMGSSLDVGQTPFLKEQFPGVSGVLSFEGKMSGTRHAPLVSLAIHSPALKLGIRHPEPFQLVMGWTPQVIKFERLEWGHILNASGTVGLEGSQPLDAKLEARSVPLAILGGIFDVESDAGGGLEGLLTGNLRLTGTRAKPLLDGNAFVTGFKAGAWAFEKMEARMAVEGNQLILKSFKADQAEGGQFTAKGTLLPGNDLSRLHFEFETTHFRLADGPRLTGRFHWTGETPVSWFQQITGKLTGSNIRLEGKGETGYNLPPFSADTEWKDGLCDLKVLWGNTLKGKAHWDTRSNPTLFSADLQLLPADLEGHPLISAFIPSFLNWSGLLKGSITIPEGPWNARLSTVTSFWRKAASMVFPTTSSTYHSAATSIGSLPRLF